MRKYKPSTQVSHVIQIGHPTLWKKAKPVKNFDEKILHLAHMLFATVRQEDGVGIAAPQIAKSVRMFVMDIHETKTRKKIHTVPPLSRRAFLPLLPHGHAA
jgi:peptide deformylase